jgi:MoaA/NifB/PqqE/SkfB family radical SAM enzyme
MKERTTNLSRHLAALRYGLVWNKPQFMARMATFYLKTFVFRGKQPLRYVDFAIDYGCNLKCSHCFATTMHGGKGKRRMSAADYARVSDECVKLGAIHLSLQGGEPTIAPNLETTIKAMRPNRVLFSLTTNGTMITEQLTQRLRKIGVDQLNVSLDSMDSKEHDCFRGVPGSWDRTMLGIILAKQAGLRVQINTTVSHSNLHSKGFTDLIDFVSDQHIVTNLVLAAPAGRWDSSADVLLTEEDMREIRTLIETHPYVRHDTDSIQLGRGCPAAKEAIYITPYGDVLCCPFIHVTFGNIHDESLSAILDRALQYPFLKIHAKKCLAAEDRYFMETYMSKLAGRKDLPADHKEIFNDQ